MVFYDYFIGSDQVIARDISISAYEGIKIPSHRPDYDLSWRREYHISDIMYFMKCGVEVYRYMS